MAERTKGLIFPVGGLNRRFAVQRRAPFTTTRCLEMRPFDPLEERERGGSRPGLEVFHSRGLLGSSPVNLLSSVNVSGEDDIISTRFVDNFNVNGLPGWTSHNVQANPIGLLLLDPPFGDDGSVRRLLPATLDFDSGWTITVEIPSRRHNANDRDIIDGGIAIDLGMSDDSHLPPGSWTQLQFFGNYNRAGAGTQLYQCQLVEMNGDQVVRTIVTLYTSTGADEGSVQSVTLKAKHDATLGAIVASMDVSADQNFFRSAAGLFVRTGDRNNRDYMGVSLLRLFSDFSSQPLVRSFILDYFIQDAPIFPTPGNLLVGASDGQITLRKADGSIERPTGLVPLDQTQRPLMAVDAIVPPYEGESDGDPPVRRAGPRLFIADYKLLAGGGFDPSVQPKVFDPAEDNDKSLVAWQADRYDAGTGLTKGIVPVGNTMITKFLGRIFLAGNPSHAWHACRVNDPMDWDFGKNVAHGGEDPSAATGGVTGGRFDIQEPLRAMAAYLDDYLIFATANSLFRLAGDPGFGNPTLQISSEAGMAGPQAWCITPEGAMVFLDQERGLFALAPGGQSYPQPLSANVLPNELKNINVQDVNAQLAYDHRKPGVHIILQSISGLEEDHWWYDRPTSSFWPLTLTTPHTPRVMLSFQGLSPNDSGVLLGGQDGVVRRFAESAGTDDGRRFTPSVLYGPFNLASSDAVEGVLRWIRGTTISTGDQGLEFEIVTGRTALDALDENSRHRRVLTGRLDSEFMKRQMVRLRGVVAYVRIFGTETPWAIETLDVGVEPLAPPRP